MDRIVSRRVNEASEAERRKFAETLGVSLEEAESIIKADREKKDKEKSDLERLQGEFDKFKNESSAEKEKLQKEQHTDRVKLRLARVGVSLPEDEAQAEQALDRVVGLVSATPGASIDDIDADIKALKDQFPALFASSKSQSGNLPSNPSGSSRSQPPADPVSKKAEDRAAEWARVNRGIKPPST